MEFNEKHVEYTDNLIKYLMRSRPPEDAIGEEMLALYPCYAFLVNLKQHINEEMQARFQRQQAAANAAKAKAAQGNPTEPVAHGKVETKTKSKKQRLKKNK